MTWYMELHPSVEVLNLQFMNFPMFSQRLYFHSARKSYLHPSVRSTICQNGALQIGKLTSLTAKVPSRRGDGRDDSLDDGARWFAVLRMTRFRW